MANLTSGGVENRPVPTLTRAVVALALASSAAVVAASRIGAPLRVLVALGAVAAGVILAVGLVRDGRPRRPELPVLGDLFDALVVDAPRAANVHRGASHTDAA